MDFSRGTDYLREGIFVGIVEDNVDPKRKGRLKIRVQGVFEDISTEHIPWSSPYKDLAGKSFRIPAIGKIVNVVFPHGNLYEPYYIYAEKYNINLFNKLDGLSDDEYKNFVALLFDHRTQIYSDDTELRLDYLYNNIKIKEDSINLHLKDNDQELRLGHDYADQSAILGDHWMEWFDSFIKTLLSPQSLLGNLGAPVLKPQLDQVMLKYQALRKTFLSQHVKIVDNASCLGTDSGRQDTPTEDDLVEIDNKKLLESPKVPEETKEKVKEQREKEAEKVENAKPDPEDALSDEVGEGDSIQEKVTVNDERVKDLDLDDNEIGDIDAVDRISERKSIDKPKIEPPSLDDLYNNFWSGTRTVSEKYTDPKDDPNYGKWTIKLSEFETPEESVSSTKWSPSTTNPSVYKGKKLYNGKLAGEDLVTLEWKDNGGRVIRLRDDAAASFLRMNKKFKEDKGKDMADLPITDSYRDFDRQVKERVSADKKGEPGNAAVPGTSSHGWGLALDINSQPGAWNSDFVKWIKLEGGKFGWHQKSTWPYKNSKGNPVEAWHWQYFSEDDIYKSDKSIVPEPISNLDFKKMSDTLYKLMKGHTNNEEEIAIINELKKLKTKDDWDKLWKTFGVKDDENLNKWLNGDMDDTQIEEINKILSSIGVTGKI